MNILFYDMGSYTYHDFLYYLKKAGHTCKTLYYHFPDKFHDDFFCRRFTEYLSQSAYDVVISVNFFPLVAQLCSLHHIKYIAWCYDSPLEERLAEYFHYETNYIFLFDRIEAAQYQAAGYTQVFYQPLAVNTDRLEALVCDTSQAAAYTADISFVGNLYDSPLETLLYAADDFTKGYIEGSLQAQLRIYGCYILDSLITEDLLQAVNDSFEKIGQTGLKLNRRGLSYAIATKITQLERSFLLEQCGELFDTRFYTAKPCALHGVTLCGPVKYADEMPFVFRCSRLNLCPTLKCIQSGIPLRALDIMGAGGTLLAGWQPELAEYFENGTDLILYESMEDAIAKADFYLRHEDLRRQIALNGFEKVKENFNYPKQIAALFRAAHIDC